MSELQSERRSGSGKAVDDEALSALSGRVSEQAQGWSRLQESVAELGQALAGVAAAQVSVHVSVCLCYLSLDARCVCWCSGGGVG